MSDLETPLTDAVNSGEWGSLEIRYDLMHDLAEDLERKLAEAREALEKIEERYVNGHDTYADHEFMGETAQQALARIHGNASDCDSRGPQP